MKMNIRDVLKFILPDFIIKKYKDYQSKKTNYFDDKNFINYVYKKNKDL